MAKKKAAPKKGVVDSLKKLNKAAHRQYKIAQQGWRNNFASLNKLINIQRTASQAMGEAMQLQSQSLARGVSLSDLTKRSEQATKGLTQGMGGNTKGLVGFGDALKVSSDALEAGLDTNSYEVSRLLVSSKLTNKQSRSLAKALVKNTAGLGFSKDEMDNLANTTLLLSENFGLTANELMGSISSLGQTLTRMGTLGVAAEGAEAAAKMGAFLGKGAEDFGSNLMKVLMEGGNIQARSMLKVQEPLNKAINMGGEAGAQLMGEAMIRAAYEANALNQQFAGKDNKSRILAADKANKVLQGALDPAMKFVRASEKMLARSGKTGLEAALLAYETMGDNAKINEEFASTWETVKGKIVGPLKEKLTDLMKAVIGFYDNNRPMFDKIVKEISAVVTGLGIFYGVIKPIFGALTGLWGATKFLFKALNFMTGGILKKIGMWLVGLLYKKAIPGKAAGGLIPMLLRGLGTLLWTVLAGFVKLLLIPISFIFGPILAPVILALGALIALITYFWAPIKNGIMFIWDWAVGIFSKISKAFSQGFWNGIKEIGMMFLTLPWTIIKGIWNTLKWLGNWLIQAIADWWNEVEEPTVVEGGPGEDPNAERQNELLEPVAKEAEEASEDRASSRRAAQMASETTALLRKINENMNVEAVRAEYANDLRERQVEGIDAIDAGAKANATMKIFKMMQPGLGGR